MTDGEREWAFVCRVAGWLLVASGGGLLAWLGWWFAECYFEWVGSADIAMTYWWFAAVAVGPWAVVSAAVGIWLLWWFRRPPNQAL